jgi:hypothetical protein
MKQTLLQQLIAERDELNAAIAVLQRRFGATFGGRAMRAATTAITRASSNGNVSSNGQEPQQKRIGRPPGRPKVKQEPLFRGAGRDIATIPLPSGVSFDGIEFPQAVALAVRAVKQPIPTPELTLLLETAGVNIPHGKIPARRYVGMIAANLKNQKVLAKTPRGWMKGSRA